VTGLTFRLKQTAAETINAFFPPVCLHCRERIATQNLWLCGKCRDGLNPVPAPYCSKCGYPLETEECSNCSENSYVFTQARSAFLYEKAARTLVHELKYTGYTKIAEWLANQLYIRERHKDYLEELDCVTAIPLHRVRKRERGFNQSELIARALAAKIGKPYMGIVLNRKNYTESQTQLSGAQRRRNLQGAFSLGRYDAKDKKILLVDDVFTTGSTVNEASKVLLGAGAKDVYVLTACHGL
jgi:competence protein ComFC